MGANDYWLVDCGDVEPLLPILRGYQLKGILLTHAHFDHIYGLNELFKLFPKAFVYTNEAGREALLNDKKNLSHYHETPFIFNNPEQIRLVEDRDEIVLDNATIRVIETPGHHPSCLTFFIGNAVFTGDSYIPGLKVVTNLPKGNKKLAEESLKRILQLRNGIGIIIYPGHQSS